jgi:hypothetical protein
MAYSFKLSKRGQIVLFIVLGGFMAAIAAFSVWYVNQDDSQIAPEDSAAGCYDDCMVSCRAGADQQEDPAAWIAGCPGGCQRKCGLDDGDDDDDNNCGGDGQSCCTGNGCGEGLDCNNGKCEPNGGSCNGKASCGNSGCSCEHDGSCSPKYNTFKCLGKEASCNSANDDPEAQNLDRCITIQYDVSSCNGTSANVVRIDADGKKCSSNDGNLDDCNNWDCDPPPQGYLDKVDCDKIAGWACDSTDFTKPVQIHIYDGSKFVTAVTANQQRSDVAASCGGTTAHGFSLDLPASLLDGKSHDINAYAIALDGSGQNPKLSGSPKTLNTATCFSPPTCSSLTSSSNTVQNGDTVKLTSAVSDPDNDIDKVEFFWSDTKANGNYCGVNWVKIGNGTKAGNKFEVNWSVTGIPDDGAIVIAANVFDKQGKWCTGNPSGKCSSTASVCAKCGLTLSIDTPICNTLSITGGSVQNGESLDIGLDVTDPNGNIGSIPLYWTLISNDPDVETDYCGEGAWTLIGNATNTGGTSWGYTWEVTGIPNDGGSISISADPASSGGTTFCTGNPGGDCGSGVTPCPTCNEEVPINIPLCGGSCTASEQCDGNMECVGGMCRNPLCTEKENCECDIPVTGLFDSARSKLTAGFILVILSFGFVASDKLFGFTPKVVFRLSDEGRHVNAKEKFEESWDDNE